MGKFERETGLFVLFSFLLSVTISFYNRTIADADGFYHLAHAQIYWENGIFYRPFPWAAYSVISVHQSDLWWGFHVLLAPLGVIKDPEWRVVAAQSLLIFSHLNIVAIALSKLKIPRSFALIIMGASLAFFSRMDTIRPQSLSAALLILLFAAFTTESFSLAITTSFFIGFLHPTLSYLVVLVAFGTTLQRRITTQKTQFKVEIAALMVCSLVALLFRPGTLDGVQLLKVQLVDLLSVKREGLITNFGMELKPTDLSYALRAIVLPLTLLLFTLVFTRSKKAVGGACVAFGALAIAIFITRRGVDQFAPFACLTTLILIRDSIGFKRITATISSLYFAGIVAVWAYEHRDHYTNVDDFRAAAKWLENNTQKGELIGQAVWSDFGPLLFWNRHNRYFGGMDPIFQYQYSPQKYWQMTLYAPFRKPGFSGNNSPVLNKSEERISVVFPRELGTKWLVIGADYYEDCQKVLKKDPLAKIRYEDENVRIYEFLTP
jgi:hypothetical protein